MGTDTQIALYMLAAQLGWVLVPLGAFVTALGFAIGVPLARAYSRKMDAEAASLRHPSDVADRLERMERALESVAIEVERISEGQRFRMLAEEKGSRENPQISSGGKSAQDRNK
jgi:hypothetical protein